MLSPIPLMSQIETEKYQVLDSMVLNECNATQPPYRPPFQRPSEANQNTGSTRYTMMVEAWERVAALPGSWHAQLWLARAALESDNTPRALAYYRESLARVGETVPTEFLQQMSGDRGNHGRFTEAVELTEPYFIPELHGLQVGNSLMKANIEFGPSATGSPDPEPATDAATTGLESASRSLGR